MPEPVIRVEHLSKRYRIGRKQEARQVNQNLLGRVSAPFHSLSGKLRTPGEDETIWALKDVSFEVQQGEVLGVIGRNGAGKSTLLKILSRITEPTSGRAVINGRVGSLLEVGTGFHPELTGRENIYLNGAILGMRKWEIDRKFDEIVGFAEVEKFLDTPVKHYSSGMYVRLAFAVAAHLETEILLVDEVLAVGDAQFQKKCLEKMGSVTKEGKTILYISHNIASIRNLCNRVIILENGKLALNADSETALSRYISSDHVIDSKVIWSEQNAPQNEGIRFIKAYIQDEIGEDASAIDSRKKFSIVIEYQIHKFFKGLRIGFLLQNIMGIEICGSHDIVGWNDDLRPPGNYSSTCTFPANVLNSGRYYVLFAADSPPYDKQIINTSFCISFLIHDIEGHGPFHETLPGVLKPRLFWDVKLNGVEDEKIINNVQ